VSDYKLNLPLTESERNTLLGAVLGFRTQTTAAELLHLATRIHELRVPIGSGAETAKAILSPPRTDNAPITVPNVVELKDRWQRSKKGAEVPFPEGCETIEAELWKVESKPTQEGKPRWKITWAAPNGGQGFVDGSCFDEKLFPFLANRVKQKTVLYVVKNGKYLNVVGVRA
jgi:hypothetical protein